MALRHLYTMWKAYAKNGREVRERLVVEGGEFDLYASKTPEGLHRLAIDVDFPVRLEPSRTPDHYHLYFDGMKPINFHKYCELLDALVAAGILEAGFVKMSKKRGMTMLRADPKVELPSDNYVAGRPHIIEHETPKARPSDEHYMAGGDYEYPY